jgi:predicted nucleic acid-binding protein
VAVVYFDSSALVKLVVEERGSDIAAALWDGCDAAVASRIAYPEVCAALAAAGRNHDLDENDLRRARRSWSRYWDAIRPVELNSHVARRAGELVQQHQLRGADAIHLASALTIAPADVVVAVWDRRLHDSAVAEHLPVAPVASLL